MAMAIAANVKDLQMIPARMALGSTMLYHGTMKLKGQGPQETAGFFENVGIHPAKPLAIVTGVTEAVAGVLALAGIGTRLAALAVLATQAVAIAKVHADKGFDNNRGGFEFNLALMAIAAGLLIAGPGRVSLHEAAEHRVERRALPFARRRRGLLRALKLIK